MPSSFKRWSIEDDEAMFSFQVRRLFVQKNTQRGGDTVLGENDNVRDTKALLNKTSHNVPLNMVLCAVDLCFFYRFCFVSFTDLHTKNIVSMQYAFVPLPTVI